MMNFRKVLALVVCVVFVFALLTGCGTNATKETAKQDSAQTTETKATSGTDTKKEDTAKPASDDQKSGKKLKIFFTNAFFTAPYCAPLNESAMKKANEMGVNLQIVDGKGDAQVQLDQIQNAIAQKVDGIIYFPADMASSVNIVKKIKESGIACIVLNSQVDPSVQNLIGTFVGPDVYTQGKVAAKMAMEALGENGGNVVIVEGAGGTEAQTKRTAGFEEVVASNPKIKILGKQQADWDPAKSMKVMEDFITKFGDKINLVYTEDDGMFQGASKVIKDKGLSAKIKAVSIGANKAGLAAVKAGELYGTASQSPQQEGIKGVESIVKVINGEKLEPWIKTESVPVTTKNISDFDGAGW